jgi:hypothetical protein
MKNFIFKIAVVFAFVFCSANANSQTCCSKELANCPKKNTPESTIVNSSAQKKKTRCMSENADQLSTNEKLSECPLAGTPECPLVKNCPKKGTKDCPYALADGKAVKLTRSNEKELPECCKKKH